MVTEEQIQSARALMLEHWDKESHISGKRAEEADLQ